MSPYIGFSNQRTRAKVCVAAVTPEPGMLANLFHTSGGGRTTTFLSGVIMPRCWSFLRNSVKGKPFRKAPETSQVSRVRSKMTLRLRISFWESFVDVVALVVR